MLVSEMLIPTLREDPAEAELISHRLLLRAGFIRKTTAGVYTYLPLASRVLRKIEQIVREEMDNAGGQEVLMPIIQPRELWDDSGRWAVYGDEMFRLKDRHEREFCLGPTHEEVVTDLVKRDAHSYRDFPLMLYQIQNKYRDEIRPRFGLMRGREFIMKDLYSFDINQEGLDRSYQKMYKAYQKIFERMGLAYRVVEADSGAIGGNASHEFIVLASNGESVIVYCDECQYAANVEKAEAVPQPVSSGAKSGNLEKFPTPGLKTIDDLVQATGEPASQLVKTLIYVADGKPVAVLIRGDRELNEIKLKNLLQANELDMADEERVRQTVGAGFGSLGPVNLPYPIYADLEIRSLSSFSCGANEDGYHYRQVQPDRDFKVEAYHDLRNAIAGDYCPHCHNASLLETRGIEVGHIFKLGTKYSEKLGATYLAENGQQYPVIMGCYGIGVSRTMAAAIEQCYDEDGIIWPVAIAPYQVVIIPVNSKDQGQKDTALQLYQELRQQGFEVVLDDRDERAGVKFKDADLVGYPVRITVGKALKDGEVEIKVRWESENNRVAVNEAVARVNHLIRE
ncbi:MAG: proline--tRNA ligase [Methylocystaceae bacterium]